MDLDKQEVLLLIQEYEKYRLIWDPKHEWHFHRNMKMEAWKEIAKSLNIDTEDAKKKMRSLLVSFKREKSRATKNVGTGGDASHWFAFKSFEFLSNLKIKPKKNRKIIKLECKLNSDDVEASRAFLKTYSPKRLRSKKTYTVKVKKNSKIKKNKKIQPLEPSDMTTISPKRKRANNTDKEEEKQDSQIQKTFECAVIQPLEPSDMTTVSPKRNRSKNTDKEEMKDSQIQKTFDCVVIQPLEPSDMTTVSPKRNRSKNTDKEEMKDSQIQKTFECAAIQPLEPSDITTKFTNYLAEKLNQFEPLHKAILIHKINVLVFEAEMKTFSVDEDLIQID